jgi:hypothetical protein
MDGFYQNLREGMDKSKALQDAKISYLNNDLTDQSSAHPYYWSAYSLVGNSNPVDIGKATKWWIWPFIFSLIALFLFFIFKNRNT